MARAIFVFFCFASVAHAQTGADIGQQTGISTGLCVRLGTTDGRLEAELTREGKFLVQGFATEAALVPKARAYLQEQGINGLAIVDHVPSLKRLPFPDNYVNLLVADLDQLVAKAPRRQRAKRLSAWWRHSASPI